LAVNRTRFQFLFALRAAESLQPTVVHHFLKRSITISSAGLVI